MKRVFKGLTITIIVFFGISFFLLSNRVGGFQAFNVMSGSMEPAISTGSLVITQMVHPNNLARGDIITFIRPSKEREFITHRITDLSRNKELSIIKTKGDHNKSKDPWLLAGGGVVGKVIYSTPYLGYILSFSKTRIGIVLFILIPSFFIIYHEISNIYRLLKSRTTKRTIAPEGQILLLLIIAAALSAGILPHTSALLFDSANLKGNKFSIIVSPHNSGCNDDINVDISGNAQGSVNIVDVIRNCSLTVTQTNNMTINTIIQSNSTTGGNQGNYSTDSAIIDGESHSNINITNSSAANTYLAN